MFLAGVLVGVDSEVGIRLVSCEVKSSLCASPYSATSVVVLLVYLKIADLL